MGAEVDLDGMQLAVHSGDDLVARYPGVALFVRTTGKGSRTAVAELVGIVRDAAGAHAQPGRRLARQVAGWLSRADADADDLPSFCLLAQDDAAVAVIVHGAAQLIISDDTGDEVLSGRKVSTWVDRVVDEPFAAMVAGAAGETPPDVEDGFDLQTGTVPGSGFTVAARTAGSSRAPGGKARPAKKRSPAKAAARPPRQVPKKAPSRSPAPPAEDETKLEDEMPAAVASAVAAAPPPPPPPPPPPAG
ncbi:MAG: hypothetical protein ACRD12_24520, partial [Acidimicrobiales bacterium]